MQKRWLFIKNNGTNAYLRGKYIKKYFNGISKYGITPNKFFWNFKNPFLGNKGHFNP